MIKNIRLFVNSNSKAEAIANIAREEFIKNGFVIEENDFDLGIAIGGDGSFLRMVKATQFDSDISYVGINAGTLGFMQDVMPDEIPHLISDLLNEEYQIDEVGIQQTVIHDNNEEYRYNSLNEIVIRNSNLDLLRANIYINDDYLESFTGDGIMLATSTGSTAYNLSYGGSIVYPSFSTLQITPMAPINSKVYRSITNSIILPAQTKVRVVPETNEIIVTVDGENKTFSNIESVETSIEDKKIKCLRFSHYSFPKKINEKFLS